MTKEYEVKAFGWMVITNWRGERTLANSDVRRLRTEDEQEARAFVETLLDLQKRDKVEWNYITMTATEQII